LYPVRPVKYPPQIVLTASRRRIPQSLTGVSDGVDEVEDETARFPGTDRITLDRSLVEDKENGL